MDRYTITQQSRYSRRPVLVGIALVDARLENSSIWQMIVERQALLTRQQIANPPEMGARSWPAR